MKIIYRFSSRDKPSKNQSNKGFNKMSKSIRETIRIGKSNKAICICPEMYEKIRLLSSHKRETIKSIIENALKPILPSWDEIDKWGRKDHKKPNQSTKETEDYYEENEGDCL